jgi:protein SCO1/2
LSSSNSNQITKISPKQQHGVRKTLVWIFGFIALFMGLFIANLLTPKGLSDEQLSAAGYFGFQQPRPISDFSLTNHKGESVSRADIEGQWSLIFFGFTFCPDVCPTTLGVLNRAVGNMKQKPQVIMVSVDPERDTPKQLNNYIPSFNKDFVGYTGDFDAIVKLATELNSAFGKVPGREPGTYTVDHTASIIVINPDGRYAGFIKAPHQALSITKVLDSLML